MTTNPKHAPRAPRTPFVLLVLGLVVGGMCLLLALNTASAANEVSRHDLAARDESAAAQLVELENQVQASAAPANLAAAAAALGMVPAGTPGFLEIGKHGQVRVLGSASPASVLPVVIPHPAPTKTPAKTKSAKSTKSAKTTKTPNATKTATEPSSTKSPTDTTGRTATRPGTQQTKSSPSPSPTPTPTPTPETTLPGGNR